MQTAGLCSLPTHVKPRQLVEDPSAPAYFQQECTCGPYLVVALWVQAVIVLSVLVGAMDMAAVLTP